MKEVARMWQMRRVLSVNSGNEAGRRVNLWQRLHKRLRKIAARWQGASKSVVSCTENPHSHDKGTLVDFCEVCFPQCTHNCGEGHFRGGMIVTTFENYPEEKKKGHSAMTSFNGIVSCTCLFHSRDSRLAVVESELSSACQIFIELTGFHCSRNTCTFDVTDRMSQGIQISKLMGVEQTSFY